MTKVKCIAHLRSLLIGQTLLSALLLLALLGCGGGSSAGSPPPPPPSPDFSLADSPTTVTLEAGSSDNVSLSATALNGFSSQIGVQVAGEPTGVSVSPTNITLVAGTPQQVTFTAAANAQNADAIVTFTGTSGSLTHTAQLSLTVSGSNNGLPSRTRYVRTDATTEYYQSINQHWIIYNSPTARYFVTDPSSNQVIVIDGTSKTKIASIGVPGAFGIDETADQTTIYAGSLIGDVYAIDPVAMTVKQRYIAPDLGPSGFRALSTLILSDGRLALLETPTGDGSLSFAIWNPVTNSMSIYGGDNGQAFPCGGAFGFISGFTLSADRTQIIFGIGETLCEMNAATGVGVYASGVPLELVALYHIVVTPDGKYVILANNLLTQNPSVAEVFDAHTLALVSQFNVLGDTASASGFFVSTDSTTLFIPADPYGMVIYAYKLATQDLVGWVPNLFLPPTSGGGASGPIDSPYFLATDGTGLYAGPMEEGVGFVDLSSLQTGALGTQFGNGYLDPATGPAAGGTATKWAGSSPMGTLKSVYFGSKQAPGSSSSSGYINATSPAGAAGPADVYAFTTDGGMQLLPEAFSYGPTVLEVTPNMATAEGGGTGYIYGYGFGPIASNSIPSGLAVKVNGVATQVTAFAGNAYELLSPPFPLQGIAYTIPAGISGSAVDVTVSTNAGSTTTSGALSYLPATQQFPLPGSTLAQGIYDPNTDLYYFTDASQLQVFSTTERKWLAAISIPSPPGTTHRLWGIALSPDGSMLAVADPAASAIYLLNPASPTAVKTFSTASQPYGETLPCGVALSDSGIVYYTTVGQGIGGADQFFKLDTKTGQITSYGINGPDINGDAYLRAVISSDNGKVFFNDDGQVLSIDTATDRVFYARDGYGCCYGNYELALSNDQTRLTATFYLYDYDLNGESYYALNDREILNLLYVYGAKLSPDGRLLFQPSTNGFDVFDGNLGNLRSRISLPVPLSPNYDALVSDGQDNLLVAITGTNGDGVAVVDLNSVPQLSTSPYVRALRMHNPIGAGDQVSSHNQRMTSSMRSHSAKVQVRTVPHVTKAFGKVDK